MILTQRNAVNFMYCLCMTFIPKVYYRRLCFFFLSVLDSKDASKAQAASPTRAPSLDGALDASDLQSFAFQIANGMVTRTHDTLHLLFQLTICQAGYITKKRGFIVKIDVKLAHYFYNPTKGTLHGKHKNEFPSCLCPFVN